MIYGLYHSAAGMLTNEYRQSVTANNLANADTVGFKRDIATFAERVPARTAGVRRGPSNADLAGLSGGMWLGQTQTSFADGPNTRTGHHTDVALVGPGFLMVDKNGETLLTRDGRMMVDQDGHLLAASDGAAVLGAGGTPIRVNPRGGELSVDEEGHVMQGGVRVAQLAMTDVDSYDKLRKAGAGRFTFDSDDLTPTAARIRHGFIEQSAVEPVKELVNMIEAARAYQINAQMVSLQDQSISRLLNFAAV